MRRVLIVSPHFPPLAAPDLQRVRMSLPFYRLNGWEPVVLCVGDAWQDGVREPELEHTIPADIRVVRIPAFPVRWTRFFGVRNLGLRCWLSYFFRGSRLLKDESFDLIFFSTTQFVTFTLGRLWRWRHGVPCVLDLQDPWRTDHYEQPGSDRPPGGWKYRFARLMAWLLEGWSLAGADGIMSVSPRYLDAVSARYRALASVPRAVIPFGASRGDQAAAMALPPSAHRFSPEPGVVNLLYTGAAGPVTPQALAFLFSGLRRYRENNPERGRRLRFHFIGTGYVAPGRGKNAVVPLAAAHGVADLVTEVPHRLGHLECLRLQREADVLLLPGSTDPGYSPSKIHPYYLAGRPVLALVFAGSVLEEILHVLSCAWLVRIPRPGDENDAGPATLARFFDAALDGFPPGFLPSRNAAFFEAHGLAETLTRDQCALFDATVAHAAAGRDRLDC
jgi:hypothetical protein